MQQTTSAKETGSLSRQASFTVSQVSRGNTLISQPTSLHGNLVLPTEGTIEETIQILSVKSPTEESSGYRRDSARLSTRDKSSYEISNHVRRAGSSGTGFFRSFAGTGGFSKDFNGYENSFYFVISAILQFLCFFNPFCIVSNVLIGTLLFMVQNKQRFIIPPTSKIRGGGYTEIIRLNFTLYTILLPNLVSFFECEIPEEVLFFLSNIYIKQERRR